MTAATSQISTLEELRAFVGDCQRCPLAAHRTLLVFGVGRSDAEVMFIGEGPGRNEDLQGEPFVGAAGKLLDELLASVGMDRHDVYIANVVKCRPPNNRDPEPIEIETCTPFLREQIRLIDPLVIVTLGKFATQHILSTDAGITRLRGRRHVVDGRSVLPIFHPAAALYDQTKRDVLLDDFKRLRALLDMELAEPGARTQAESRQFPAESEGPAKDAGAMTDDPSGPPSVPVQETLF